METQALIKEYLASNTVMQLATINEGKPQLCTVHYAFDDLLNLYWSSSRAAHHSIALDAQEDASAGILQSAELRQCVHLNGKAHRATNEELAKAHEVYSERFGADNERLEAAASDDVTAGAYYIFTPSDIVLFDAKTFPESPRKEYKVQ
jgi:uncharacterized protein YhbP (UPF0306 family)